MSYSPEDLDDIRRASAVAWLQDLFRAAIIGNASAKREPVVRSLDVSVRGDRGVSPMVIRQDLFPQRPVTECNVSLDQT
jgi:hypothetical protein